MISNINSTYGFRNKFINELSKYKTIDMGGIYKNNVGRIVRNKISFLSFYKFQLQWKILRDKDIYQKKYLIHL